jgi:cysteine desulfurase
VAEQEAVRQFALTARLRDRLPLAGEGVMVAGEPTDRLPHVVTVRCTGVTGEILVGELARRGFSVASGSACTSDIRMPSQVLAAMGLAADASVRISLPLGCTAASVEGFLAAFPEALAAARGGIAP